MGDRRQAILHFAQGEDIYVYVHWSGTELPQIVRDAILRAPDRWNDEPYLARVIVSDVFTAAGIESVTGAGIAPYDQDGDHLYDVKVDLLAQTVSIGAKVIPFQALTSTDFEEGCS